MKASITTEKDFETLDPKDWLVIPTECFESLCVSAVRYCQGRRTYMPHTVLPIVLANLQSLSSKTLAVLISDYEYAKRLGDLDGSEADKLMWERYASGLYFEQERRRQA